MSLADVAGAASAHRPLRRHLIAASIAALMIAGCASWTGDRARFDTETDRWSGRLGLTVASEPPQSFSAGFSLSGSAEAGELSLTSPLGSTLAVLRWQPGEALLSQGEQSTRRYESIEALAAEVTGAPIPVRALFAWLHGTPQAVDGWNADLSQLTSGRLRAERMVPPPTALLRIVLDR